MDKVLRVGRHGVTLIAKDFAYWRGKLSTKDIAFIGVSECFFNGRQVTNITCSHECAQHNRVHVIKTSHHYDMYECIQDDRVSLAYRYAKICNDRWNQFEKLHDAKSKEIAQKLCARLLRGSCDVLNYLQMKNFMHVCIEVHVI